MPIKSKKVKAVFKGLDGSCGYRKGQSYLLTVSVLKNGNISIYGGGLTKECEYQSIISFLENWDQILVATAGLVSDLIWASPECKITLTSSGSKNKK